MDKKALLIKMDSEMHKKLKMHAVQQCKNMTDIVLKLIEEYLEQALKNRSNDK